MLPRRQPDTLCAHFEFVDRTDVKTAIIHVEDIKLGRQLSTVHVTLYQGNLLSESPWITSGVSKKKMVAYITCSDLSKQAGLSLPTSFSPQPSPRSVDLQKLLKAGEDDHWVPYASRKLEKAGFKIRLWDNLTFYVPREGQPSKSIVDVWLRLTCGERFTNTSIALVADAWAHLVEGYRASPGQEPDSKSFAASAIHWYPTVALNLDMKKGVPPEGAEWLRMRVTAKEIRNGKLDMETLIYDESGNLVALSHHVNLILSADRNLAKRGSDSRL